MTPRRSRLAPPRRFAGSLRRARGILAPLLALAILLGPASFLRAQPEPTGLRAYLINGLWHRFYRLDEAMARTGFGVTSQSWATASIGFGFAGPWTGDIPVGLEHLPALDACTTHDVIVICNVHGKAIPPEMAASIKRHVERGGGLLLLGGRFAFGGQFRNNPALAEVAPVTFSDAIDLSPHPAGLAIRPTADPLAKPLAGLSWDRSPATFWIHAVEPKPDAHVILEAGGKPLLIYGSMGKGRVALFAGTVLGETQEGKLPFWEWNDWPAALAGALAWVTEPIPANKAAATAAWGADLRRQADQMGGLKAGPFSTKLLESLPLLDDPATAASALRALADSDGELPEPAWAPLLARLTTRVGASSADAAQALVDSGHTRKAALGLAALGAARGAAAVPALLGTYHRGAVKPPPSATHDDIAAPLVVTPEQTFTLRMGVVIGLGLTRDPAARPALRNVLEDLAPRLPGHPDRLDNDEQLFQLAWLSLALTGDAPAGARVADMLLENIYAISRARSAGTDYEFPNVRRATPTLLAWQQLQWELIGAAPAEARVALSERFAAIDEVRVVPAALAALDGKTLPPKALEALRKSPLPALRELAGR